MDPANLIQAARENWPKPIGLVLAWLAVLVGASLAGTLIPKTLVVVLACGVGLFLTIDWIGRRRVKKCPSKKFGFVVAISVDDKETYRIFERDFIQNIESLLHVHELAHSVWVYYVPQFHLPKAVTQADAESLRLKTGAKFVLYGQLRTRKEEVKRHYLDLSGLVGHSATSELNRQRLSQEFTELLPRRLIAAEGTELPAFELTSSLSSMVAKYIAGIAAFLSGNIKYAEAMYVSSLAAAQLISGNYEVAKKIVDRVPFRLTEIALAKAGISYELWKQSRSEEHLVAMATDLDAAPVQGQDIPQWKVLRAISLVANAGNDLAHVQKLVGQTPMDDPVTHMNLAFFDVVNGDLRGATKRYRRASDLKVSMDSIDEVMSFLEWFQEYRPQYVAAVNFALGYIAYYLLQDKSLATEFFQKFSAARDGQFAAEETLIAKWMGELTPAG